MENTLIFSIVVYNEKYWDSVTFKSLLSSYHQSNKNEKIHILVFDNTISPNKFTPLLEENNVDVTYFSFNENRGISHAYNFLHNVATNKGFEDWTEFLGDPALATAVLDRLTYRCDKILMDGKSYRLENRKSFLNPKENR